MADLYDILNSGILDNWNPNANRPTFSINKAGISSSIPNNDILKIKKFIKGVGKGTGVVSTAIPFYKDFALPVANDMYNFVKGNPDKSKLLQFAINASGNNSKIKPVNNKVEQRVKDTGVPFDIIEPPQSDVSDIGIGGLPPIQQLQNVQNAKQQPASERPNQQVPLEGKVEIQQPQDVNSGDVINDYIARLQSINQPYIKALESYINNYNKNLDQARRADLYFYGANLAKGLDPRAGQKFNPLQNQMETINAIKALQDARLNDMNSVDELAGNIAVAKASDLPEQAAFANKNLLSALTASRKYETDLEKARIVDAMRKYGYDSAYARAIMQQLIRNQGNKQNALIYSAPNYASAADALEMLNALGIDLDNIPQQPQVQQNNTGKSVTSKPINSIGVNDSLFIK